MNVWLLVHIPFLALEMSLFLKIVFIKLYDRTFMYHTVLLVSLHFESLSQCNDPNSWDCRWILERILRKVFWDSAGDKRYFVDRGICETGTAGDHESQIGPIPRMYTKEVASSLVVIKFCIDISLSSISLPPYDRKRSMEVYIYI